MKRIGCALAIGFGALLVGCSGAETDDVDGLDVSTVGRKCGNPNLPESEIRALEEQEAKDFAQPEADLAAGTVTIKVYAHVINKGAGVANGDVSRESIEAQIEVLNNAFGGNDGPGAVDTPFRFELVEITRTTNAQWFTAGPDTSAELAMKTALRKGGAADLNMYFSAPGGGLLGWATFPNWYASDPKSDGVVILNDSLPGGAAAPYDLGDTATHEVGHWLGLYHTFQGGCRAVEGVAGGDLVKDTPRVASPNFGAPAPLSVDSCPNAAHEPGKPRLDLVENFMDYTDDIAMDSFTKGQTTRMQRYWTKYRANQ